VEPVSSAPPDPAPDTVADAVKLTIYFSEQARSQERLVADLLLDLFERHSFRSGVLLRGIEGFGLKHHLHTLRLENLALDLPAVAVGVDRRERIETALPEVRSIMREGLVTLERAQMPLGGLEAAGLPQAPGEETKLTVYCGRLERTGGLPAYVAVVDLLQRLGVAGATVLLGVDGMVHGRRHRARFFGRNANAEVPLMIVAVGDGRRIARALVELEALLEDPLVTLERVRVCKRDGVLLAPPPELADNDAAGRPLWQKLMVYSRETATHHGGAALYIELVRRLRAAGASGATTLRGIWGYHGDHAAHGDRPLALRRHVPVLTVLVDRPSRIREWFQIVDALTGETGLVTSETVPAFHATATTGSAGSEGLLRLE
jgi:PII-like signaling protein